MGITLSFVFPLLFSFILNRLYESDGLRICFQMKASNERLLWDNIPTSSEIKSYAIPEAATWVIDKRLKERHITVCNDNQATLSALCSPLIN